MAISKGMIEAGIGMVLFIYIVAAIVPGAMTSVVNGCSTAWSSSVQALWGLLPIFIVIALILLVYKWVK